MITIRKGPECTELQKWKNENKTSPQNIHYDNLGRSQRGPMLKNMSKEQGWICAYTMKRLIEKDQKIMAHIEHILPRCLHPRESVVWENMVACVPFHDDSCEYGAKRKDKYDPAQKLFVFPTKNGIRTLFYYHQNGKIDGHSPEAEACISENVLNLNHPELVNDRRAKIRGALDRKPTATAARRRAGELRKFDSNGKLEPYCEAVAQVLERYASMLEERARRVAGKARQ